MEEDTNSQCTCFGAAIKPVRDCNYEKSKELIMYRAYNGSVPGCAVHAVMCLWTVVAVAG